MYLTKIVLHNFRGATDLILDMNEKLNVFYGPNGAGKSTILDAMAACLTLFTNNTFRFKGPKHLIKKKDIHNGREDARILVFFHDGDLEHAIELRRHCKEKYDTTDCNIGLKFVILKYKDQWKEGRMREFPLLAYYPVNRAVLDMPLRIKTKHTFEIPDALRGALSSAADFRAFFEWFRDREDLENENLRIYVQNSKEVDKYFDPQLNAVRTAIYRFMPGFSDLTVRRSPLRMEVKKEGQTLRVEQLSDGEKCLIAMVGDIARRLAIANPNALNPLECDGVILIDEIDLHLHPTWQHVVVSRLIETFPNCQFLISTHSPHVITHVAPENLFSLKLIKGELYVEQPRESYGKNVEQILRNNMGLPNSRPDSVAADLDDIYQLIDAGNLETAQKKILELRYGVNGKPGIGNDPELVRSAALMKRKELVAN